MSTNRVISAVLATLVAGCVADSSEIDPFIESNKADGHKPKLHKVDDHKIHVDEPSDLLMTSHKLYTVSDAHSKIYQIDTDGDVQSEIDIDGNDLEALAYDNKRGEFLVADETKAKIWHIDASGSRRDPLYIEDADDGNSGIEGMTFDDRGHLLIGKEKNPARIIELDAEGNQLDTDKLGWISDLSALAFHDGHLWILSDEDRALYRVDADHEVEYAWRLPIDKPEGLAFYGSAVYVASDSEARLYEFELEEN